MIFMGGLVKSLIIFFSFLSATFPFVAQASVPKTVHIQTSLDLDGKPVCRSQALVQTGTDYWICSSGAAESFRRVRLLVEDQQDGTHLIRAEIDEARVEGGFAPQESLHIRLLAGKSGQIESGEQLPDGTLKSRVRFEALVQTWR